MELPKAKKVSVKGSNTLFPNAIYVKKDGIKCRLNESTKSYVNRFNELNHLKGD